jgi:phosphate transport system substrate-binding protein
VFLSLYLPCSVRSLPPSLPPVLGLVFDCSLGVKRTFTAWAPFVETAPLRCRGRSRSDRNQEVAMIRYTTSVVAVVALALLAAACNQTGDQTDGDGLSGTIRIDGSSTVAPLSEVAAQLFEREHLNVRVTVGTSGTGGGFEKFCAGETDISDASRPIRDEEAGICQSNGIAFEQVAVANDALSVLVHPDNPVDCLTVEQLNQIWAPGSTVENWNEIEGLGADFDAQLDLYGPGTDSGTFDYFTDAINGEEGAQRTDYNDIGEDDRTGIVGVSETETPGGMFYVGFSFFVENQGVIKALEIDGGDGCVEPSLETVQDGTYTPLGRELFIYPSGEALQRPEVLEFIRFYIEQEDAITEAAGYIDLTDEQQQEAERKVEDLAG